MEVKIGVRDVTRELVLESTLTQEALASAVAEAVQADSVLRLEDDKGRMVLVPAARLGYVEIGASTTRHVGFGAS